MAFGHLRPQEQVPFGRCCTLGALPSGCQKVSGAGRHEAAVNISGNTEDYRTSASGNLTLEDSDYRFNKGQVAWSYEEDNLNSTLNGTISVEAMDIGDVNNDTHNDIIVLNKTAKGGNMYDHYLTVYLYNTSTGDFDDPMVEYLYEGTYLRRSLEVANLDDDGWTDIVAYSQIKRQEWPD